ncbi:hypothetical protein DFJ73DRAFT_861369 [Zopfochytrium polystomum]|nr:hypothetical protein DFJ73DRAFT_861369 [Zopfochytrium polystomum]
MPHMVVILFLAPALAVWVAIQISSFKSTSTLKLDEPFVDDRAESSENEEAAKLAAEAPFTDAVWQIGVSGKAVAVSEEGALLAFEFSKSGKLPTVDEIVATVQKAAGKPNEGAARRPRVAMVLSTRMIPNSAVDLVAEKVKGLLDIRVASQEALEPEMPELNEKRKAELEKTKAAQPAQPAQKPTMQPPPARACFVCKKDIEGKPRQCSACKAIIYCSPECATKDWPQHKIMCGTYKSNMLRLNEEKLHNLPFTFYSQKKQLENFNQVPFLVENNIHNVGVYRRLCQCFGQLQWGELSGELAAQMDLEQNKGDPEKQFALTGLPKELYPLGKPFKEGTDVNAIESWEAWYNATGLPLSSPVAIVFEVPLTLWYMIKNFAPVRMENGRRQLTIHLLGPEREADLIHILPSLFSFLPKTDIVIHMIGPNLSKRLRDEHRSYTFANDSSTLHVSLRSEEYLNVHYDGSAFGLDRKTRGASPPDLVVLMNAAIFQYPNYFPTIKLLMEKGQRTVFTEPIETSVEIMSKQFQQIGGALSVPVRANPFRQPIFQWKKEVNLPGWSNGFLTGMGKF